jgi:hypothetical protein
MTEPFITGRESRPPEPPITTVEGLKKEANTAVIRYFAPVFAIYNEFAATAGLPTVRWWDSGTPDNTRTDRRDRR